jgi:hypothetical protein
MPSIITHAAVPLALWCAADRGRIPPRLLVAGVIAAMLPDADVLAFALHIPYAMPSAIAVPAIRCCLPACWRHWRRRWRWRSLVVADLGRRFRANQGWHLPRQGQRWHRPYKPLYSSSSAPPAIHCWMR